VGPGASYLDEGSGGPQNDFTNRNTTFMTWNLMHLARMLHSAGGIPAHENSRAGWDRGERFDFIPQSRWTTAEPGHRLPSADPRRVTELRPGTRSSRQSGDGGPRKDLTGRTGRIVRALRP
jgi:hypothetical protein